MSQLVSSRQLKQKLQRRWQSHVFHKAWLADESLFPFRLPLRRPTDKQVLHQFDSVRAWVNELGQAFGTHLVRQEVSYSTVGRQSVPVAVAFADIEALARFLGQWQAWQRFCNLSRQIQHAFPGLAPWLQSMPAQVLRYADQWPRLLAVCRYFVAHPQPGCYVRELDIPGVDTKFIEAHKSILKAILDQLLPPEAINQQQDKLAEHGFAKRYGLKYEQPRVRFRLLDANLAADVAGLSDLEIPVDQFARLDLLCDRVVITENKTNGLAFPALNNAIVIFGLGYDLKVLKAAAWLQHCRVYYWGDIDTHGFAMLSQARAALPHIRSFLMDEATLLHCRDAWGEEPPAKRHRADRLPHLSDAEQSLYQRLKGDHWQPHLRLEQERIPHHYLRTQLAGIN